MNYYRIKLLTASGEEVDLGSIVASSQAADDNETTDYQPVITTDNIDQSTVGDDTESRYAPLLSLSKQPLNESPTDSKTVSESTNIDLNELAALIGDAVASALKQIKVYVVESEISMAQNAVKTVVEQSKF